MSKTVEELITARLRRSEEAYHIACYSLKEKFYNTAASELYYSCFYLLLALFAKNNLIANTHSGVKSLFNEHFIKTKILDIKIAKYYNQLFEKRQTADYADFVFFEEEDIIFSMEGYGEYKEAILKQLNQ